MTERRIAGLAVLALVAGMLPPTACSRNASDDERSRSMDVEGIDPRLQRIADTAPDSVVGVFVRTSVDVGDDERTTLEDAGLRIGTVTPRIVTGRIAAGDVERLARVPFVMYIEVSDRVPVPQPPVDVSPDSPESG